MPNALHIACRNRAGVQKYFSLSLQIKSSSEPITLHLYSDCGIDSKLKDLSVFVNTSSDPKPEITTNWQTDGFNINAVLPPFLWPHQNSFPKTRLLSDVSSVTSSKPRDNRNVTKLIWLLCVRRCIPRFPRLLSPRNTGSSN